MSALGSLSGEGSGGGSRAAAWSWLHNVVVPAMVVVAEAGWASLLLGAIYNGSGKPAVDLPFLALAVPGVAAVVVASWGGRAARRRFGRAPTAGTDAGAGPMGWRPTPLGARRSRRARFQRWTRTWLPIWWRSDVLVMVLPVIVGMAITAGVISELSVGGSFARVAVEPWTSGGHRDATVAGAAWVVSILVWLRGTWLGTWVMTGRHAVLALMVGAVAFLGIFAGRAIHHTGPFGAVTAPAGWLFFVSFPLMAAAVALVHQRDLERAVLRRAASRPSGAWVAVLATPMAVVALVSLLLAVLVGPAAPTLGRAIGRAASAIGAAFLAAARWITGLLPRGHPRQLPPTIGHPAGSRGTGKGIANHTPITIPAVVLEVLFILVVVAVVVYVLFQVRIRRRPRTTAADDSEESESLFSWQHLFDQFRSAFARLAARLRLRRRRRAAAVGGEVTAAAGGTTIALDPRSVREVYRGMLVDARQAGAPRARTETSQELATRLTTRLPLGEDASDRLLHLTGLYESVRYGGAADVEHDRARADAAAVIPALRVALAPEEPQEGTPESLGPAPSGSA